MMFKTNLMTDRDIHICRSIFAPLGIFQTVGSTEPCKTHHKKGFIFNKGNFIMFFSKCIVVDQIREKGHR